MSCSYINNWYPVKLFLENDELYCRWKYFKDIPFIDPFFSETESKASILNVNTNHYKSTSSIKIFMQWANAINSIEPTAFIFHISRCGSTLLSQTLSLADEYIVLSEVPFIDDLLKLLTIDEWLINTEYQAILKAAIAIYGQNYNGNKKQLFIKTDSWHLYYLPLLRLLYPTTPFLLLYRNPIDVLHSQQKKRGMHAIPNFIPDTILGIAGNKSKYVNFDEHMIKVLESYLSSFIKITNNNYLTFLTNYNEGIENINNKLVGILNIQVDDSYKKSVHERCLYNAKYPDQPFEEENINKEFCVELNTLYTLYNALEETRNKSTIKQAPL